ncbi:MAG: hypothetical protein ACI8WB_000354 [Phenylobacterium sp.]|jgi:hypothetical protein
MKHLTRAAFSLIFATTCLLTACSSSTPVQVDLDRVLDITTTTMDRMEQESGMDDQDSAMLRFSQALQIDINMAEPKLHSQSIGIALQEDGSINGFSDDNINAIWDDGEADLFKLEIDSEKNRLIASQGEYVRDQRFSGSGLIAGLLIGHMLSRQRGAGVKPGALSSKTASPARSSTTARSRSGSGSHSSGK